MTIKTSMTMMACVAGLGLAGAVTVTEPETVCEFQPEQQFDARLPASHIQNQCSRVNMGEVSWLSWVAGRSLSYDFHYLDLLELLHDDSNDGDLSSPQGE
ncbi:hypothetical protein OCL06_01775 [Alteromonas sp. ASW11-19]|uniref:Uncharacterized protein n=1 Tax=Alteromonas salexigens TaxID=2982530 RepID=A0ABT2VJD2_9ALTE|nr:hypothetical protein [Alteromonas salexigens]MCU7553321.1 hypothetical protein [Alteromonas salexigens]